MSVRTIRFGRSTASFAPSTSPSSVSGMQTAGVGVGQPPYDPSDLLKLYLYGYINQIRSSRRLEREACRNLELIWLLKNLKPGYRTIANFRRGELGSPEGREPQFRAAASRARHGRWNPCCGRWRPVPRQRQQGQHLHARKLAKQIAQSGSGDRGLREGLSTPTMQRRPSRAPMVRGMATRAAVAMSGTK